MKKIFLLINFFSAAVFAEDFEAGMHVWQPCKTAVNSISITNNSKTTITVAVYDGTSCYTVSKIQHYLIDDKSIKVDQADVPALSRIREKIEPDSYIVYTPDCTFRNGITITNSGEISVGLKSK